MQAAFLLAGSLGTIPPGIMATANCFGKEGSFFFLRALSV